MFQEAQELQVDVSHEFQLWNLIIGPLSEQPFHDHLCPGSKSAALYGDTVQNISNQEFTFMF